jgi:hypothetical protein
MGKSQSTIGLLNRKASMNGKSIYK